MMKQRQKLNYDNFAAGGHSGFSRQTKKVADSLFVMANHGQLLEYSLDPVPDPSKQQTFMPIV